MEAALVYLPNITAVLIIAGLCISSYRSLDQDNKDVRAISIIAILVVFDSLFAMLSHFVDGYASFAWLNSLSNSMLFIVNAFVGFSWVMYVKTKLNEYDDIFSARKNYYFAIPAIIVSVMAIINLFTPVFYKISSEYIYQRTSLYAFPSIVAVCYIAYGAIEFRLKMGKNQKYRFYPVLTFLFPVTFFAGIQMIDESFDVTTLGLSIGISLLYLNFKNEQACVDSLTGLFNRQYFDRYLSHAVKKDTPTSQYVAGLMMDIDKFKSINDTYGHLVGNDALREAAKILLNVERHTKSNIVCFRYGGDEFVILLHIENKEDVFEIAQRVKEYYTEFNSLNQKPYKIEFSIGCAVLDGDVDTAETFVKAMDNEMYKDKQSKRKAVQLS